MLFLQIYRPTLKRYLLLPELLLNGFSLCELALFLEEIVIIVTSLLYSMQHFGLNIVNLGFTVGCWSYYFKLDIIFVRNFKFKM